MQHEGHYADRLGLHTEPSFFNTYDISHFTSYSSISSLIVFVLSHLTETVLVPCSVLVVMQANVDTKLFAWYIPPFHMHWQIILSHSLVTEIKLKLTGSKIGSWIAFLLDRMSNRVLFLSILPVTHGPSPFLRPNSIVIWWSAREENAGVQAYGFNKLRFHNRRWIVLHIVRKWRYAFIRLRSPRT